MSVIFFSEHELGELGAVYLRRSSLGGDQEQQENRVSYWLSLFSRDNAKAWTATYGKGKETAERIDSRYMRREVRKAYYRVNKDSVRRAASTARLMHYNCVSNGGEDFAERKTLTVIIALLGACTEGK